MHSRLLCPLVHCSPAAAGVAEGEADREGAMAPPTPWVGPWQQLVGEAETESFVTPRGNMQVSSRAVTRAPALLSPCPAVQGHQHYPLQSSEHVHSRGLLECAPEPKEIRKVGIHHPRFANGETEESRS